MAARTDKKKAPELPKNPVDFMMRRYQSHKKRLGELHNQNKLSRTEHDEALAFFGSELKAAANKTGQSKQLGLVALNYEKLIHDHPTFAAHREMRAQQAKPAKRSKRLSALAEMELATIGSYRGSSSRIVTQSHSSSTRTLPVTIPKEVHIEDRVLASTAEEKAWARKRNGQIGREIDDLEDKLGLAVDRVEQNVLEHKLRKLEEERFKLNHGV